MIHAHFTLPCLYLAQKKIFDRLNIPSLAMICILSTLCAQRAIKKLLQHLGETLSYLNLILKAFYFYFVGCFKTHKTAIKKVLLADVAKLDMIFYWDLIDSSHL
jgi:hypothetical protein